MAESGSTSAKKYFVLKLIAPRATFAMDMTEEERNIMKQHTDYWRDLMARGSVLVFGPVLDPKGVWGLGIVEAENEEQVRTFTARDPAITSGLNKIEIYPILAVVSK